MKPHDSIFKRAMSAISFPTAFGAFSAHAAAYRRTEAERLGFEPPDDYRLPQLPFWIDADHFGRIESDLKTLLNVVSRLGDLRFGGDYDQWSQYLELKPEHIQAMRPFYGRELGPQIARPDGFLSDDSIRVCELNIDSGIGGFGKAHRRCQYFKSHSQLNAILGDLGFEQACRSPLSAWRGTVNELPKPVWVIKPDPADSAVKTRLNSIEVDLLCRGLDGLLLAPPEQVKVTARRLSIAGRRIRSVFRTIADQTLAEQQFRYESILRVIASDSEIRFVAPNTTSILENKLNLALLWDGDVRQKLKRSETNTIGRLVPKTYKLSEELAPVICNNRREWVVKKANSKSGTKLCIGRDVSRAKFEAAVAHALSEGGWVAQEFVESPRMDNLFIVDGKLRRKQCPFLVRVFLLGQSIVGMDCLTSVWDDEKDSFLNSPGYGERGEALVAVLRPKNRTVV